MNMNSLNFDNVVVLILSTVDDSYNSFKKAQQETWIRKLKSRGVKCYFYHGNMENVYIDNHTIGLTASDSLVSCTKKFSEALKVLVDMHPEVQLVYRTNLSSYLDPDLFIEHLSIINRPKAYYAGKEEDFNYIHARYFPIYCKFDAFASKIKSNMCKRFLKFINYFIDSSLKIICYHIFERSNYKCASGSGFFLGSDHFDKIINNKYVNYVDDVAVRLSIGRNVDEDLARFDFTRFYSAVTREQFQKQPFFHYRFKTDSREFDATLLKAIDNKTLRDSLIFNDSK